MSEDIEERFRAACAAYLAAAEEYDRAYAARHDAEVALCASDQAVNRARDQLLQVVRERDLAGQLDAGPTAGKVTWMTPQEGSVRWHDMVTAGICPECGVSWGLVSEYCPKRVFNRHILG